MYRKPTDKEVVKAFNDLAFELNLHRTITMNHGAVVKCLERVDRYVQAHADGNGERTDDRIQQNINRAFWEHLAQDPVAGQKPVKAKKG